MWLEGCTKYRKCYLRVPLQLEVRKNGFACLHWGSPAYYYWHTTNVTYMSFHIRRTDPRYTAHWRCSGMRSETRLEIIISLCNAYVNFLIHLQQNEDCRSVHFQVPETLHVAIRIRRITPWRTDTHIHQFTETSKIWISTLFISPQLLT